jgi:hypothetical protein
MDVLEQDGKEAFARIARSPDGRVALAYLTQAINKDYRVLARMDDPHQTRRLQGSVRRSEAIIALLTPTQGTSQGPLKA